MTRINADITTFAHVDSSTIPWVDSPVAGVERKRLERIGEEVARVTSLVRYAPNSNFTPHTHGGGEEFLVLEGVFGDEHGDYPAGTYVRNPVGSSHTPRVEEQGCLILVKLWWMHPEDQERVVIDFENSDAWQETAHGATLPLFESEFEHVELHCIEPGCSWTPEETTGGDEVFIISGEARAGETSLAARHWVRRPGNRRAKITSDSGALIYVKSGHLDTPPALPEEAR
jgi:anti-sigma factor ChrR (cupin superfamily)